jgi:outer membrane lipoprotein SlyB
MKTMLKIMTAFAVVASSGVPVMAPADAHTTYYPHRHRYHGRVHYARKYCRRSSATTGTVVGGVGGALVGHSLLGHGLLGTAAGAVGGAVAGGAIDRSMTAKRRCYYR